MAGGRAGQRKEQYGGKASRLYVKVSRVKSLSRLCGPGIDALA